MDDMINPFQVDQWIQWRTDNLVKRGRVVESIGPSIVVEWMGGGRQVFPLVWPYLTQSIDARMEVIERPREAAGIERDERRGVISVRRAASILGTTPKRVRAMLRDGQLEGERREGKWASVRL